MWGEAQSERMKAIGLGTALVFTYSAQPAVVFDD